MCFLFIDEECYFVFLYITICLYNPWLMNIGLFSSCGVIIYLKAVIVCVHDRELVSALDFFFSDKWKHICYASEFGGRSMGRWIVSGWV